MQDPLTFVRLMGLTLFIILIIGPYMYKQHLADKEYKAIIAKRTAENQKKMWSRLNERS